MSYDVVVIGRRSGRTVGSAECAGPGPQRAGGDESAGRKPPLESRAGGQLPGACPVSPARRLLDSWRRHARQRGAEFRTGKVLSAMPMEDTWYLSIGTDMEHARALVLAAGREPGKEVPRRNGVFGSGRKLLRHL